MLHSSRDSTTRLGHEVEGPSATTKTLEKEHCTGTIPTRVAFWASCRQLCSTRWNGKSSRGSAGSTTLQSPRRGSSYLGTRCDGLSSFGGCIFATRLRIETGKDLSPHTVYVSRDETNYRERSVCWDLTEATERLPQWGDARTSHVLCWCCAFPPTPSQLPADCRAPLVSPDSFPPPIRASEDGPNQQPKLPIGWRPIGTVQAWRHEHRTGWISAITGPSLILVAPSLSSNKVSFFFCLSAHRTKCHW